MEGGWEAEGETVTFYVNLYRDGATFEESPAGDACQPLELSEQAARAAAAVCVLNSFELSQLVAEVYLQGVRDGERAARTGVSSRRAVPPAPPAAPAGTPG